ncbi:MAG: hypothetical protein PUJ43_00085 [Bacillales bacterium]|nr:hypothetical protein [Bacillales bacterium]MDY5919916.1 hypothetical protein [Candidatus Enteromonas sp.]
MMKRVLLCLASALALLASCGDDPLPSSSSWEGSSESLSSSSSIEEPSSSEETSSEDVAGKKAAVSAFIQELAAYRDGTTYRTFHGSVLTKYGTGTGEFVEIDASQSGTETLYRESPVGTILVKEGTETIGEETSSFLSERYVLDDMLYDLTRYETGEGSKQKTAVNAASKAAYFDLSFAAEQVSILSSYLPFIGRANWATSFSLPCISGDGGYEMSYEAILYTEGLPDQRISYSYSFRIDGGSVVSSLGRLENVLYLLGEPHQMQCSDIERSYEAKENGAFAGEILDPDDYPLN